GTGRSRRLPRGAVSARHLFELRDEVAGPVTGDELFADDAVPGGAAGIGGAGHAADQGGVGEARQCPRLYRGGADVAMGELPEQLAEAFDGDVEQGGYRLGGGVAPGEAGAAGDQHDLDVV